MTAKELFDEVMDKLKDYQPKMEHINQMPERGIRDVLDRESWLYYQFLACLTRVKRPKQFVELGGAMGVACVCILSELPKESRLYSITLPEGGLEFSFIKKDYPNLVKVLGNDLDLSLWPKECQMEKTDIFFFDSKHTEIQLRKELDLYSPRFKKDAVLLFDDIHINPGMFKVWTELPYNKLDVSELHIPSGFGLAIV